MSGLKSRPIRGLLTAGIVVAATVAMPVSASADVSSDGLWYYQSLNVQAAHDAGITGDGVTVAVLDSPVNLAVSTLVGADVRVQELPCWAEDGSPLSAESDDVETAVHGTSSVSMIVGSGSGSDGQTGVRGVAPDATVLFYAVGDDVDGDVVCFTEDGKDDATGIARGIRAAVAAGADIISLSVEETQGPESFDAVVAALHAGVVLVMGASNQGSSKDVPGIGAYAYNGVVAVQAVDRAGNVATHTDLQGAQLPNIDRAAEISAPGVGILTQGADGSWQNQLLRNGTSLATPIVAGFLADVLQKYPEASGNQLIQSLIANAGGRDGVPAFGDTGAFGWGFASLTNMLAVDPTQYPDVNPLVIEGGSPTAQEIEASVEPATATPAPTDAAQAGPSQLGAVWGVLAALFIGLAAIATLIIYRGRRKRVPSNSEDGRANGR